MVFFLSSLSYCFVTFFAFVITSTLSSSVQILTVDTFDSFVNKDNNAHVFVEFYAPWCGHCKSLEPVFEVVANTFSNDANVILAKVDATEEKALGEKFGVTGYPTLKYFPKGSTEAEDYSGGRTEDDLIKFLNGKAGTSRRVVKPASHVEVLTPGNFDSIALNPDKAVLVEFYAPWCGHCKSLEPKYEIAGAAFAGEEDVVIAKVDADAHRDLGTRFGVSGFPTLKFFGKGAVEVEGYEGGRDEQSIVDFMNEQAGTHRLVDGGLKNTAGRLDLIDVIISDSGDVDEMVIEKTEMLLTSLEGEDLKHANLYVKAMKKILAKGESYVETEILRLEGMIQNTSVSPKKKTLFLLRKNILMAFKK